MKFVCHGCKEEYESGWAHQFCHECYTPHLKHAQRAIAENAKRIRRGEIPKAAELICVDCGKQASVYDHRSYFEPLKVDPVCRTCNMSRGPALSVVVKALPVSA